YEQPEYEQPKYEKPEYEQPDSGNPYTNPYGYPKYAGSLGEESEGEPGANPTLVVPNLIGGLLGGMMENLLPTGVPPPSPVDGIESAETALSDPDKKAAQETIKIVAPHTYYTGPELKELEEEEITPTDALIRGRFHGDWSTPAPTMNTGLRTELRHPISVSTFSDSAIIRAVAVVKDKRKVKHKYCFYP
ncbi:hypothetical protein K3495_g17179, partial [Podosphaera aphanis]